MGIEKVYKLIDKEREYQDALPQHNKELDAKHSVADWVIYMEKLVAGAKECIYNIDELGAMGFVRKATATGIAAMENKTTPSR